MYRNKINELKQWKLNASKKPLIIRGARQVGKTWLMREFARTEYEDFIYVNFEQEKTLRDMFKGNLYPQELLKMLEIQYGIRPRPEKTLILSRLPVRAKL